MTSSIVSSSMSAGDIRSSISSRRSSFLSVAGCVFDRGSKAKVGILQTVIVGEIHVLQIVRRDLRQSREQCELLTIVVTGCDLRGRPHVSDLRAAQRQAVTLYAVELRGEVERHRDGHDRLTGRGIFLYRGIHTAPQMETAGCRPAVKVEKLLCDRRGAESQGSYMPIALRISAS